MPVYQVQDRRAWRLRDRKSALLGWLGWFLGVLLVVICFQFVSQQTQWAFVWDAPQQIGDLFSRMVPPQWSYANRLWIPLWDTVNIATLGTLIGIIIAIPVALLAARNTTPHPIFRQLAMFVIAFSRSVNALIWALLLVSIIGPGVLAGVIAIGLRSIGFIAKLLYEAIEEVNHEAVEAVTATGARKSQVLSYGIVPQIMPAFAGISIYRWDINIRQSTVVGLVGAGGIGLQLNSAINALQWAQASVIFIMIFALVVVSEWVSAKVRQSIT